MATNNLTENEKEFLVYFYEKIFDTLLEVGYNPNELFGKIINDWESLQEEKISENFIVKIRDEVDEILSC